MLAMCLTNNNKNNKLSDAKGVEGSVVVCDE